MPVLNGIEEFYKKIDLFRSKDKIFVNEKARAANLAYVKEQAKEELKFKKKLIA
jgi:hypothetical protein